MKYFEEQQLRLDRWREKYRGSPRKVALRMAWWNFRNLFRRLEVWPPLVAVRVENVRSALRALAAVDRIQTLGDCVIYVFCDVKGVFEGRTNVVLRLADEFRNEGWSAVLNVSQRISAQKNKLGWLNIKGIDAQRAGLFVDMFRYSIMEKMGLEAGEYVVSESGAVHGVKTERLNGLDIEDAKVILKNARAYVGNGDIAGFACALSVPVIAAGANAIAPRPVFRYALEGLARYTSRGLVEYRPVLDDIVRVADMDDKRDNGHIYGPENSYIHASKRWEYPYILERLAMEGEGRRLKIADVGAGRGALALYTSRALGHEVTVFDMSYNWEGNPDVMLHNRFMRRCAEFSVRAAIASGFNIPAEDGEFDAVVCASVVEHVLHKEYMLDEMLRVLKPGGALILTYDLLCSNTEISTDHSNRIEILTPMALLKLLDHIDVKAEVYREDEVAQSALEALNDDLPFGVPGMTCGGCVIRKLETANG